MAEAEYVFKNYLVVEFVKENSVNLIPACWIVPNSRHISKNQEVRYSTYWPKSEVKKKIRGNVLPDGNWAKHKVRILHQYNDIAVANKQVLRAIETDTLETESEESSREERQCESEQRQCDSEGRHCESEQRQCESEERQNESDDHQPENEKRQCESEDPATPSTSDSITLEGLYEVVKENTRLLNILVGRSTMKDSTYDQMSTLQLTTTEEVQNFEKSIDIPKKKVLVQYLSTQGGTTAKEATRRIMRNLLSYELMTKYSYRGKMGKLAFDQTILNQIITQAVLKQHKVSILDVESAIADVLRLTPFRLAERNERKRRAQSDDN